jgi:hypothetical protein
VFNRKQFHVRVGKYLSGAFHIEDGLKSGDALSQVVF